MLFLAQNPLHMFPRNFSVDGEAVCCQLVTDLHCLYCHLPTNYILVPRLSYFSRNWHSCCRSWRRLGAKSPSVAILTCMSTRQLINTRAIGAVRPCYKLSTCRHIEKATRWIWSSRVATVRQQTALFNCRPLSINHGLVTCRLSSSSPAAQRNNVTMRPWKKLDMSAFTASLRSSVLCTTETDVLRQMSADWWTVQHLWQHVTEYSWPVCSSVHCVCPRSTSQSVVWRRVSSVTTTYAWSDCALPKGFKRHFLAFSLC